MKYFCYYYYYYSIPNFPRKKTVQMPSAFVLRKLIYKLYDMLWLMMNSRKLVYLLKKL